MASPTNLMDFKSPNGAPGKDISGTQSPGCNPFDDLFKKVENISSDLEFRSSPFTSISTSFKDIDRPSLAPIDFNSSDLLARESLGILPNAALCRDSLAPGFLNISVKEMLDNSLSPRESLGVLNISAMDVGRESIGLFNIQNSFLRRESVENEKENVSFNLDDFNFDSIENGLKTVKKSPLQKDNPLPELILSTSTTQDKINSFSLSGLNHAFLFSHSRIPSVVSSGSSYNVSFNPYFNSRSLEEPSRISPGSSQKDSEKSQSLALTDPFNEAFQMSTNENNKHSVSQILTSTCTRDSCIGEVENIRNRIQSLPVTLEDNNILADIDFAIKATNVSFQDGMVCRGIEDEKEFDDSVFVEARKVASIIADTSFIADEKSFDSKDHNILDATPQPEWPAELDSSQSNIEEKGKSPKCNKETILKQVDKMLGMQPVNLEEKLKLKNDSKSDSTPLENTSQNISKISGTSPDNHAENQSCVSNFSQNLSKISRTSQEGNSVNQSCASNNFSQNLSKITQTSEENVSRLIQNLSDIINENENLSQTQKKDGRQMLQCLANMLCDSKSKSQSSAEDSGHSSVVDDRHLEENKGAKNDASKIESKIIERASGNNNDDVCHALDLSCKGKSCSSEINRRLSMSKSPAIGASPVSSLIKTPNRIALATNTSNASIGSNTSDANKNASKTNHSNASNCSNASAKSGNLSTASRHSNISQNRVSLGAGKLRKSKLGVVVSKKGPLRAVLPVENMAKGTKNLTKSTEDPVTPDKKDGGPKFGLASKKTSTPIQEPKLKPMAASTPAYRQSKDSKEHEISPLPRPKYNRSISYQPRTSSTFEPSENSKTTRESTLSATKTVVSKSRLKVDDVKLVRRNSITEGTLSHQKDMEGPMRIKRSFSTGKEPKILSALNRVRQNILNSPYYNPKKGDGAIQSSALTENAKKIGTDLKVCGQELKRLSMMSQPKKYGKENVKP